MTNGEVAYNVYVAHESARRASGGVSFQGWNQLEDQGLWEAVAYGVLHPGQIAAEFDPVVANGGPLVLTAQEAVKTDVGAPLTEALLDDDGQQVLDDDGDPVDTEGNKL